MTGIDTETLLDHLLEHNWVVLKKALPQDTLTALREEALKLAYEEAASAEELTDRRYASGAATIFNLLDAQTRRISAESAYIQAQQQRVSNRVRLYLAIGGEFVTGEEVRTASAADVSGTIVPADSVTGE